MDHIAGSESNSTEVQKIIKEIVTLLEKEIKAWHSNYSEIDQSSGERFTDLQGHKWDKEEHKFAFKEENVVANGLLEGFFKFLATTCLIHYYQDQE